MAPMIDDSVLAAIHDRLAVALQPPRAPLIPLIVDGHAVGWVDRGRATRLVRFDSIFQEQSGSLRFVRGLGNEAARTAALDGVVRTLAGEGLLSMWRDETYTAAPRLGAGAAFAIERA